ncbi:RNA binding protein fox-1 homolog 1 isoform X4 [Prionailurus iriomotensis]
METAQRTHASGTYSFLDRAQHSDIKADCNTCVEIEDRKASRQQMNCEREQLR